MTTVHDDSDSLLQLLTSAAGANATMSSANATGACTTADEDKLIAGIAAIVAPIAFAIIGLTGLVGNVLVVIVVLFNAQMRSTTNVLILNLAISDLLFVCFCVPFTALDYVVQQWPFGDIWCKTVQYMIVVTANSSIYTLVLMSLDRYLAVVHPIASRTWRTERNTVRICVLMWLVIVVASLPAWFAHGEVTYESFNNNRTEIGGMCKFADPDRSRLFHVAFFCSSYLLPLCLISGLYIRMLMRLWRTVVGGHMSAESHRGRKRVTRLVVIVVAAFAGSWFPIQMILVLKSIEIFEICSYQAIMLQIASHIIAYASACINPLLYAFLSDNFRKAFRKVIYCRPTGDYHRAGHHPLPLPTKSTRTGSLCPDLL